MATRDRLESWMHWYRFWLPRRVRRFLIARGIGYVLLDADENRFWWAAMQHAPISFRWFGRTLTVDELDFELGSWAEWEARKEELKAGDRVWPFIFNPDTLATRAGYVFIRDRQPIGGLVVVSS